MKNVKTKVLNKIADEILNLINDNEGEYFEISVDDYFISGTMDLSHEWVDQSLSHEFGIEYCGEMKVSSLDYLNIEWFGWIDEYGEDHKLEFKNNYCNYVINYVNKSL